MATTHMLKTQGQTLSPGLKFTQKQQPLTIWTAKNRHDHQAWDALRHSSHLLPEQPRIGIISWLEVHSGMAATHKLKSQGQALSAG